MIKTSKVHNQLLFSTQVYYKPLISSAVALKKLNTEIKTEAYQLKQIDHEGLVWCKNNYKNGYTSYGSNRSGYDKMHRVSSTFDGVEKKIRKHVNQYLKMLDYDITADDLCMTHFWVNIMSQNTYHAYHIHPQSVISGTYYVDVPTNAGGLRFEDPRFVQFMNAPSTVSKPRLHNERLIELAPKNGSVVLFESWLKHEVPPNHDKKDRISISFNYGWK